MLGDGRRRWAVGMIDDADALKVETVRDRKPAGQSDGTRTTHHSDYCLARAAVPLLEASA